MARADRKMRSVAAVMAFRPLAPAMAAHGVVTAWVAVVVAAVVAVTVRAAGLADKSRTVTRLTGHS